MSQADPQPTLYIVDASAYIFKNFHGMRERLSTVNGEPVQAVFGYIRTLFKILRTRTPTHIAIAFDTSGPTFRHEIYPDYKANRPPPPPSLPEQYKLCVDATAALGFRGFEQKGLEADDVIGTLVTSWVNQTGGRCVIVGTDKDMLQLVSDQVRLWDGADRDQGPPQVIERLGVRANQVIDMLGLSGDSSDNIPGVPGIGPKTAAQLLTKYDNLESLLDHADEVKGKRGENLRAYKDQARLSAVLATIKCDADLGLTPGSLLDELAYHGPDLTLADQFFDRLGFERFKRDIRAKSMPQRQSQAYPDSTATSSSQHQSPDHTQGLSSPLQTQEKTKAIQLLSPPPSLDIQVDHSAYLCVTSEEQLLSVIKSVQDAGVLSIDLETTSLDAFQAEILGVALAWASNQAAYIPIDHFYLGVPQQVSLDQLWSYLTPILLDPDFPKVCQNHKYDRKVLAQHGIDVQGWHGDPMLMAHLLDPNRLSFGLDALTKELLNHNNLTFKEVAGKSGGEDRFRLVPVERATEYAAEDADMALRLYQFLLPQLKEVPALWSLYTEVELPLNGVLAEMELAGVKLDLAKLKAQSSATLDQLLALQEDIISLAGERFNVDSPRQLASILFDKLDLVAKGMKKKTKTGQLSTRQDLLESMRGQHPIIDKVLEYRHLAKLRSTYLEALPSLVSSKTKRLHTSFKQTGTATGRLSSSDPNLQNIPLRTPEGRQIREAFITDPGWVLISADYSQVELRLLAHFAEASELIKGFIEGADIHAATASQIFDIPPEDLTSDQRRSAKAINFGLMYGMGPKRLSETIGVTFKEAKIMISTYFEKYGEVRTYFTRAVADAELKEAAETLMGRRRPLPDINRSGRAKSQADRLAVNTPIQGTAADILKVAMVSLHREIKQRNLKTRMLLTVHDELVLEAPEDELAEAVSLTKLCMEEAVSLSVPLAVEVGTGSNWSQIH